MHKAHTRALPIMRCFGAYCSHKYRSQIVRRAVIINVSTPRIKRRAFNGWSDHPDGEPLKSSCNGSPRGIPYTACRIRTPNALHVARAHASTLFAYLSARVDESNFDSWRDTPETTDYRQYETRISWRVGKHRAQQSDDFTRCLLRLSTCLELKCYHFPLAIARREVEREINTFIIVGGDGIWIIIIYNALFMMTFLLDFQIFGNVIPSSCVE